MKKILFVFIIIAALFVIIKCTDDTRGKLCTTSDDCSDGYVCITQVMNCAPGTDCWGTCEISCEVPQDCNSDEECVNIQGHTICRPIDYQTP